ncbi:MAG: PKD domain-containing protein, partial [Candidatus Thermoplasmatota archaeon]
VVLRVKDDKGAKSSPVNSTVIVAPLPKASESKVLTYTNITFSVNTTKIDTAIKSIKWDFGDGDKGEGASVIHEYKDNKEYKVVLNITDKNGNSATSTLTVTIENRAPIAEISITTKPDDIYSNAEVKFNGKTSKDMDAKNPANPIAKYDWEFGDGSIANGSEVSHVYLLPRNYTVNLTVTDDDGATNKTTTTIIVKKDLVIIIEEINVTFYRDPVSNATKANVSVKYDNYMTQKDANTIVVEVSTYNPEQPTKPIEVKNITSAGSVGPGSYDRQTIREIGVVQGTPENTEFLIRIYYKGNLIDEYRYKTA